MNAKQHLLTKTVLAAALSTCYVTMAENLSLTVTPETYQVVAEDNTSLTYTVTLTNASGLPMALHPYTVPTGTLKSTYLSSDCPFGSDTQTQYLSIGQSCTVSFIATEPSAAGNYKDTWEIIDGFGVPHFISYAANVLTKPNYTLTAIAGLPSISAKGNAYTLQYRFTNQSGGTLPANYTILPPTGAIENKQITDSCYDSNNKIQSLANNTSCLIQFTYTPNTLGALSTSFSVDPTNSTRLTKKITSTVNNPGSFEVTYLPNNAPGWTGRVTPNQTLDVCFEYKNANISSAAILNFTNTGNNITKVDSFSGCPTSLTTTLCSNTLAAGTKCTVHYTYRSTSPTEDSTNAVFTATGTINGKTTTLTDNQTLISVPTNTIAKVTAKSSNITSTYKTPLNALTQVKMTILNSSASAMNLTSITPTVTGGGATFTHLTGGADDCSTSVPLNANQECIVRGLLTPTTSGVKNMTITVTEGNNTATWTGALDNGGATITNKEVPSIFSGKSFITALAKNGNTILLGSNNGLAKSTDDGEIWTRYSTTNGLPHNEAKLLAIGDNSLYVGYSSGYGLAKSTDGGNSWTTYTTTDGLPNNSLSSIYANGSNIYVGTSASGLGKSTNAGSTWTTYNTTNGLPGDSINSIYASGSNIYVGINGNLSKSTDDGDTWTTYTAENGLPGSSVSGIYANGSNIYVATNAGIAKSTDGGNTWTTFTALNDLTSRAINSIFVSGNNIYGTPFREGIVISPDDGQTWTKITTSNGIPDSSIGNIVFDPNNNTLYFSSSAHNAYFTKIKF